MSSARQAQQISKRAKSRVQMVLVGCNHRTAPVELRERIAFTPAQAVDAAAELRRRGVLEEAVVVSTCNRSELYGVPRESDARGSDDRGATSEMESFSAPITGFRARILPGTPTTGRGRTPCGTCFAWLPGSTR